MGCMSPDILWQSRFLDFEKQEWTETLFCREPWGRGARGGAPLFFCPLFVRLFTKVTMSFSGFQG